MFNLEELVERAQKGDREAFGEIYKLFLDRIFRFIYFSLGNYELAQDLTQNTFLRVFAKLSSFSVQKGSFQAFLFTVARNLVIDWRRKRKEISLQVIGEGVFFGDFEEDIVRKQQKEIVWQALSKLEKAEREIVILRFFEDLSFFEIGKVVGKSEGATRVAVHRVLKKLKKYLEGGKYGN